jgi:uncharacterized membrane protein YqgA involved in biofilm formation
MIPVRATSQREGNPLTGTWVNTGAITLLASHLHFLQEPAVLRRDCATSGLMILGIGINLMEMARIRIGNFLPAPLNAIVWAVLFAG